MGSRYYLQVDGSTDLYYLDGIQGLELDLPDSDFRLVNTLSEGSIIDGIGIMRGRKIKCAYQFKGNEEWEREQFIDWFTKHVDIDLYLYKDITQRYRFDISSGSTFALFLGSTGQFASLSTGDAITAVGIPSSAVIDGKAGSTGIYLSAAATATISNQELEFNTFLGRMRVYAFPAGGESWNTIHLSDGVEFNLLATSPYFQSTSLTSISLTPTSYAEYSTTVSIVGRRTPAIYTLTCSTDNNSITFFQVKTAEGYGFRADRQILAGDVVAVNSYNSDLTFTYNGLTETGRFDPASTPFMLEKGTNNLDIVAAPGTISIQYYERQL